MVWAQLAIKSKTTHSMEVDTVTPVIPDHVGCACADPNARYDLFEAKPVGVDETDGRYADVALLRCRQCGRGWLRVRAEYEDRPRSGKWARGLISDRDAETLTPEAAASYLAQLPWHLYGGSAFGDQGRRSGPILWGP